MVVCVLIALLFFFCWRYPISKPFFVTIIFVLLLVISLLAIAREGLVVYMLNSNITGIWSKFKRSVNIITYINSTLGSVCQWIFAVTYFEVALKTPVYMTNAYTGPN